MGIRENITIVLVNPSEEKNIGLAARAMKTMGISSLKIIAQKRPDFKRAAITAVHAADIIKACTVVPNLKQALQDSVFIAGITRRQGKFRKYVTLTPEQLAERVAAVPGGRVSLVFGTEKHGLSDAELSHCHVAVNIPSSPLFPSLNLSHAVQIITYILYRHELPAQDVSFSPVPKSRVDSLAKTTTAVLKKMGIFKQAPYHDIGVFFQDIMGRAGLSDTEAARLESILGQIDGILTSGTGNSKSVP
jgi:tRNA/rRNA methyltransferase